MASMFHCDFGTRLATMKRTVVLPTGGKLICFKIAVNQSWKRKISYKNIWFEQKSISVYWPDTSKCPLTNCWKCGKATLDSSPAADYLLLLFFKQTLTWLAMPCLSFFILFKSEFILQKITKIIRTYRINTFVCCGPVINASCIIIIILTSYGRLFKIFSSHHLS